MFELRGIFEVARWIIGADVAKCEFGDQPLPLSLRDATEATRIGMALTQSLRSGRAVDVE